MTLFNDIRERLEKIKSAGSFTYMDDAPNDLVCYEDDVAKLLKAVDLAVEFMNSVSDEHPKWLGMGAHAQHAQVFLGLIKELSEGE